MRTAIVIGGATCVYADIAAAAEIFTPDRVYAINDIGAYIEKIDVWCTLHPELMDKWVALRLTRGYSSDFERVAPPPGDVGMHGKKGNITRRVSYRWPKMNSSASSGIYGAKVALDDGYDRVVLAGIPMTTTKHFVRDKDWEQRDCFMPGLKIALPHMLGKVRSMSGYTEEILGRPTAQWLSGDPIAECEVGAKARA